MHIYLITMHTHMHRLQCTHCVRIMGILDIARIHMVVLSCLSVGLLGSISYFEKVWADVQQSRGSQSAAAKVDKEAEKTD